MVTASSLLLIILIYQKNNLLSYSSPGEWSSGCLAAEAGSVFVILQVGKLEGRR